MRMRDLKDALKGKTERLECAEALLTQVYTLLQAEDAIDVFDGQVYYRGDLCQCIDKIEQFFKSPIDKHE